MKAFGMTRRCALAGIALAAGSMAYAQADYPTRPITLIVPYGAGGGTSNMARALGDQLAKRLGQPVVLDYKPGAGGTLGVVHTKRAKADGYTLTLVPLSVFRQPYLSPVQYDPLQDVSYISTFMNYSYAIGVPASSPWKTIDDLVKGVKAAPDKFSYAGSAQYSSNHLAMVELGRVAGLNWTFVPFKGDADAITALLGNHVNIISATSTIKPFAADGKVRILAVAGDARSPDYPGVPTLKEAGYNVSMNSPLGVGGPPGLPKAIVDKLDAAIKDSMSDPEFINQARFLSIDLSYRNAADYTAWAKETYANEKSIIGRLAEKK
jgi:tripartite-type tricarboxylate transporter receptor subunit TctC